MTKDLHEAGDGEWLTTYPAPDEAMVLGEGRLYNADADDLVIFSYGNGVPMSLRAARSIEAKHGWKVRVVDLRWLVPLNEVFIAEQAKSAKRILIVDEGRHSAGVGEGVITAIAEAGFGGRPFQRVVGVDTYTPVSYTHLDVYKRQPHAPSWACTPTTANRRACCVKPHCGPAAGFHPSGAPSLLRWPMKARRISLRSSIYATVLVRFGRSRSSRSV